MTSFTQFKLSPMSTHHFDLSDCGHQHRLINEVEPITILESVRIPIATAAHTVSESALNRARSTHVHHLLFALPKPKKVLPMGEHMCTSKAQLQLNTGPRTRLQLTAPFWINHFNKTL